jgi:DNA-binding MarR family transcriptional regulator
LVRPKHQPQAKDRAIPQYDRSAVLDDVIAGYEALMQRLADSHAPEFLEIAITMPQAKLLYLLGAVGELHMSDLVQRLGVSLSTISGLVDKVVDQGLASRREDPADRRQVVVALTPAGRDFIDRFRELNARQMRELLELLGDDDLASMRDALAALATAAAKLANTTGSASPRPAATARKDPE